MKKIDYKEFSDRLQEVAKARRIFIPNITNNITVAFELYQEILAEERRDVFVSTITGGREAQTEMHDYDRPVCPEDNIPLYLKVMAVDRDGKIWSTSWYCKKCGIEFYSDKTTDDWIKELTKIV